MRVSYSKSAPNFAYLKGTLCYLSLGVNDGHNGYIYNGVLDCGSRAGKFQLSFRQIKGDAVRDFLGKKVECDGVLKSEDGDVILHCGWMREV